MTIAFIGGSITQGSAASSYELCYVETVAKWFRDNAMSEVTCINAGIGATDSEYGAVRVSEDVLKHNPDIVVVEYSVNDDCSDKYMETYEGLIRQVLGHKNAPALFLLANVQYNNGFSAEPIHRQIAEYYKLPIISVKDSLYKQIYDGIYKLEEITKDGLHPLDLGHKLIAKLVVDAIKESNVINKSAETCVKKALTINRFENAIRYDARNDSPIVLVNKGFEKDLDCPVGVYDCFKNGYKACTVGSFIEYRVWGSCISVVYKKTIKKPAIIAKATVDGNESEEVLLDANFEEEWGDKLTVSRLHDSEMPKEHTVRITITEVPNGFQVPFYLNGIIVC